MPDDEQDQQEPGAGFVRGFTVWVVLGALGALYFVVWPHVFR